MVQQTDTFIDNRWKRTLIIVPAFVMMYLVSYVIDPFCPYWQDYFSRSWTDLLSDWGSALASCVFISEMSIIIHKRLNKKVLWTERPGRRFILEATFNFAVILGCNLIVNFFWLYICDENILSLLGTNRFVEETKGIIQWLVISSITMFVVIGINTGNYLIVNWKNEALKSAELNQIAAEAELQSLKAQIDPHFVFNNLSVLSELILENQQLGYEYTENFSKIYRYLLVNAKKDFISLEEELKFLSPYIFIIEKRLGEGVKFEIDVTDEYRYYQLPPLTIQLLVENAMKHNKTNKKYPLIIKIYTNDKSELVVENELLPIEKTTASSGLGIKNIIRRYKLLSDKEPVIFQDEKIFKITIPLLKL